jgi:hypothetical protein
MENKRRPHALTTSRGDGTDNNTNSSLNSITTTIIAGCHVSCTAMTYQMATHGMVVCNGR